MKKRIRVVKINGLYVKEHDYSQGQSSHSTTPDPLQAIDLNDYKYNGDLLCKCLLRQGATIEEYDVTIEKVGRRPIGEGSSVGYPH